MAFNSVKPHAHLLFKTYIYIYYNAEMKRETWLCKTEGKNYPQISWILFECVYPYFLLLILCCYFIGWITTMAIETMKTPSTAGLGEIYLAGRCDTSLFPIQRPHNCIGCTNSQAKMTSFIIWGSKRSQSSTCALSRLLCCRNIGFLISSYAQIPKSLNYCYIHTIQCNKYAKSKYV